MNMFKFEALSQKIDILAIFAQIRYKVEVQLISIISCLFVYSLKILEEKNTTNT